MIRVSVSDADELHPDFIVSRVYLPELEVEAEAIIKEGVAVLNLPKGVLQINPSTMPVFEACILIVSLIQ